MKEISYIKRGIALFLAFWMLFTSIGFSVALHYCEGNLIDWSVLGEADECVHEKEVKVEKSCCAVELISSCHEEHSLSEKGKTDCCSTDNATLQLVDDFEVTSLEVQVSQSIELILPSFIYSVLNKKKEATIFYTNSSPPILAKQGLTFVQSFLL